ncbi:MAG: helix-turn-helix transcriptional regulator [Clostridia bacterium]|nr:helix-turn-helix transcriptional regulator [Clostridia bacterium]
MIRTEELARRIAVLRKQKGLTQSALAEKMDVTPQAVSKWETGRAMPDLSHVDELAAVLSVEVTYLLWGQEEKLKSSVERNTIS